ncbi:hypothetical protein F5984_14885 [Rudanella paleaurantiibacter]|uniref:Uncharacterized protein n=1 Tax=Rudanella paleaurantiibacter TaxID=2614655 RepID=A0A7J5U1F8_9BACT|nr:hypothetical protein [Rudanella paleaurantiibacter]KAB7730430.1 hypothetical protein F5984_14885 [Rudanella paleaurantiibacter]
MLVSCLPQKEEVPPLTGVYKATAQFVTSFDGQTSTQVINGTLTVYSDETDQITFTQDILGHNGIYEADRTSDVAFTLVKSIQKITVNTVEYEGVLRGNGQFSADKRSLTMNTATDLVINGKLASQTMHLNAKL